MSALQSQETLRARLKTLPCHFTWDLDGSRSRLLFLRDDLKDIGTEEGYLWLGQIYNLLAYVHYQLGFRDDSLGSTVDDALRCFYIAAEAFRQIRNTVSDEGPWLVVNYGNLAWVHFHMGELARSHSYMVKVELLLQEYPSPLPSELHQEIYAEKAWTLMMFGPDKKLQAVEYFKKATQMEPNRAEWNTSHALALATTFEEAVPEQEAEILLKLKLAKEHDLENLHLAAIYLGRIARQGKVIEDEARLLANRVLKKPVGSYSGIKPLLRLYRTHASLDEAIDLADEALERHPNERYMKRCLASCYKWKIFLDRDCLLRQSLTDRAITLHQEVIALYTHSSLPTTITLANLYAESSHHDKTQAEQIYRELLESNLEQGDLQMLHYNYAKYLNYYLQDRYKSIEHHMKAAEIPYPSKYRKSSIKILTQIKQRQKNKMCGEIEDFLANLQEFDTFHANNNLLRLHS